MYVVVVEFGIKPAHLADFEPAMRANARASLADEAGCRQFDVCQDPDNPAGILLYEIYDDADAFKAHLGMVHYKAFDAAVAPWVASKKVSVWTRIEPA